MREDSIEFVMQVLGSVNPTPKVNTQGNWGMVSCPLHWNHKSKDYNPSFGVSLGSGKSWCNCFGCGYSGSLQSLAKQVYLKGKFSALTYEELTSYIANEENKRFGSSKKPSIEKIKLPESYLDKLNQYHSYWGERGYSKSVVTEWLLGYDDDSDRVLVPWISFDGEVVALSGRLLDDDLISKSNPKYLVMPKGFDRGNHLFGEHRITGKESALMIVEGMMDAITATQYIPSNIGVVAIGSAHPTERQLQTLRILNKNLILALDNDEAGRQGRLKFQKLKTCNLFNLDLSEINVKDVDEAGIKINELLDTKESVFSKQIKNMLSWSNNLTNTETM